MCLKGFVVKASSFKILCEMATTNADLRIYQRNSLTLEKDLKFSGLVQNVYVYRMAKSKKIRPFLFTQLYSKVGKKCMGSYGDSEKWR